MMLQNKVSRYHVAVAAVRGGARVNEKVALVSHEKITKLQHMAQKAKEYAMAHGQGKLLGVPVMLCSTRRELIAFYYHRSCGCV